MTLVELKFHDYKYFPYERRLAELEVLRLLGTQPVKLDNSLQVHLRNGIDPKELQRLTYFQEVSIAHQESVVPYQTLLEASATKLNDPYLLGRQQTRYSAHGLHEYRGKFNPQVVRVTRNILGLDADARVWDPFCGSGTVLLEGYHQGFNVVGVDMNPLAVAITNAKLAAVRADPGTLREVTTRLNERLNDQRRSVSLHSPEMCHSENGSDPRWLRQFRCPEYLMNWFPTCVLMQFCTILEQIDEVSPSPLRQVFRIVLSDIARSVSWQEPSDLRIRRRKDPAHCYPAIEQFVVALEQRIQTILSAQNHLRDSPSWQDAFEGDSAQFGSLPQSACDFLRQGVDCIISSPPYANALPYIDTQRLSIALFNMATTSEIRDLDSSLVGSREISPQERRALEDSIEHNRGFVASEVVNQCRTLKHAYTPGIDGFRRQNTPAVLYRYFVGMTHAMEQCRRHLRAGGWLVFVVGPNRTSLGGEDFLIDTPALLAATGERVGLELMEMHELDTYRRFDVHRRNSIREERLVVMRRPQTATSWRLNSAN